MKSICLGLWLLSLALVAARQVDLDSGNVSFNAPDDFTPLTQDELDKKFAMQNGPMQAVGNETRGVSISYAITKFPLLPEQLPDAKKAMADEVTKVVPTLQWVKNDFAEINGTKWIYFENITPAKDGAIHNIEMATSYRNVLLVVNFNATATLYASYQDRLKASIDSLKVHNDLSTFDSLPSSRQLLPAEEYMRRGFMQMDVGYLTGAEEAFNAALLVNPSLTNAQIGLGRIDSSRDLFQDAINHYSEAIADDPHSGEAYARRANAEAQNCEMGAASIDSAKSIAETPASPLAYRVKAYIEERSGDLDHALADYNKALSLRFDYGPALNGRGWLNMIEGHLEQAQQDFLTVSSFSHQNSTNSYDTAVLLILEGKPDAALLELQAMPELMVHGAPTDDARLLIWVLESEAGDHAQANQELSAYLKDDSQFKKTSSKNFGAFLTDQMSEADLIASADSSNPLEDQVQHCRVWYFIGIKHELAGEHRQMTDAFRKCLATGQRYFGSYLLARAQLQKSGSG